MDRIALMLDTVLAYALMLMFWLNFLVFSLASGSLMITLIRLLMRL